MPRTDKDQARYWDAIADTYRAITRIKGDDFHYGPMIAGESELRLLPPLASGMKALELGCGEGQNSIWLARKGLHCTAVDVSEAQLRYATADAKAAGVTVDFRHCSIEAFDAAPETFDLVSSSHAFEFLQDPFSELVRLTRCLKRGGHFVLSTVHPVYNGDWVSLEEESGSEIWGRFIVSYFHPQDDIREQPSGSGSPIASKAWPVSAWFNAFRSAGLHVTRLEEPPAVVEPAYESDDWRDALDEVSAVPSTLILVGQKR